MKDYRTKELNTRLDYFKKYYEWSLKTYDCDSSLFLMNYIFTRLELNIEQRYWMTWLYGNTYNIATAWVIANEFPDFENVDLERLTKWNNENYKRLRYQNDQKWQKGHLPKMFESYRGEIYKNSKSQEQFFKKICCSEDGVENFNNLYKYVDKNFFKFGRYSAWFYLQTLKETCDLNLEPPNLLLEHNNTHTQRDGLLYAVGMDELVGNKQSYKDLELITFLNSIAEEIIITTNKEHPNLRADYFNLETTLCAFKKTFRKSRGRYLGYYLDRQYEDISRVESDGWNGIDWELLWDGRNEILLSKTNRRTGVVKEDMEYFLETGKIKYYEYIQNK